MYNPKNVSLYEAALAGALAGMGVFGNQPIANQSQWDTISPVAGAWAQAFDTAWGTTAVNTMIIEMVESMSNDFWATRNPSGGTNETVPSTWTSSCNSLIAAINSASAYVAAQGIVPTPVPIVPTAAILAQPTWYIAKTTGNDSNDGKTPATALKTDAERQRRLGNGFTVQNNTNLFTVIFTEGMSPSDPFDLSQVVIGQNMQVVVRNSTIPGRTGTITAVTQIDRTNAGTGGNALTITDGAVVWTVGQRVTIVGGPRNGARGFVGKVLGPGQASFTSFALPFGLFSLTNVQPQVGDNYVVDTLQPMYFAENRIRSKGRNGAFFTNLYIQDGDISQSGLNWLCMYSSEALLPPTIDGCKVDVIVRSDPGNIQFTNCFMQSGELTAVGGRINIYSGYLNSSISITLGGCAILLDQDVYVTGTGPIQVSANGAIIIGAAGFFDCTDDCIIIGPNGYGQLGEAGGSTFQFANVALYGNGNTARIIHIDPNGNFCVEAATGTGVPVIPIALTTGPDQITIGDSATAQYYDAASGTFQPPAGIIPTWASLAAAPPAGFNGEAHNPGQRASFTKSEKHV